MPLYLAIDAGGTKTRCLLADETGVLGRASGGTVKLMRVAEADATTRLRAMLAEAAQAAGVSLRDVGSTCFGLAGSRSESVRDWAARAIAEVGVGGRLTICGDEEIALDAAFQGRPGILVIAGTGSNAIGRRADGRLFSAGGWGPVLGDEGSGYWIGLEAVRAALRARDESESRSAADALLREVERVWKVASLGELVAIGNLRAPSTTASPPDFAGLAPAVAQCAADGNEIAAGILRRAGEALAGLVLQVRARMCAEVSTHAFGSSAVAFTGSILGQIARVREAFFARLADGALDLTVRETPVDPLDGALWRARRAG